MKLISILYAPTLDPSLLQLLLLVAVYSAFIGQTL